MKSGDARAWLALEELHAPHLVDYELLNALRRRVTRRMITPDDAAAALERWRAMGVRRHAAGAFLQRIWELRRSLSAYDAAYVALAQALDCQLATADRRLSRAPGMRSMVITVAS